MDHVAYPDDAALDPLAVPYICNTEFLAIYNSGGFRGFPDKAGWVSESDINGDARKSNWQTCSHAELARRAQAWLYFGLLSAFLEMPIQDVVEVMVTNRDDETRVICSAALPDLLRKRQHIFSRPTGGSAKPKRKQQAIRENDEKLWLLRAVCLHSEQLERRVGEGSRVPSPEDDRLQVISCSIRILLQTLGCAKFEDSSATLKRLETHSSTPRYPGTSNRRWRVPNTIAIQRRMIHAGWCPAQIRQLSQAYSCSSMYFFSGLRRQEAVTHVGCSETECIAYNVDSSTYKQAHTTPNCECFMKEIDTTELNRRIIQGQLPIVVASVKPDGGVDLKLDNFNLRGGFVAVSHVWSGGLGNPDSNGLHMCQLKRIMNLARERLQKRPSWLGNSTGKVAFWLDTLCIPSGEGPGVKAAKGIAISKMSVIFSEATAVMVLDQELQKIDVKGMAFANTLAYVLCSAWMMRCWTLREASLANNAFVQFRDARVPLKLPRSSSRSAKTEASSALLAELGNALILLEDVSWTRPGRKAMWNLRKLEVHQAFAFSATWNNFLGRSTTKAKDFYRNFSAMQDLTANSVNSLLPKRLDNTAEGHENIMKAILKGHATLPLSLLYLETARGDDLGNGGGGSFVPPFPPTVRLDASLGYMKVFSDYLVIKRSHKPATIDELPQALLENMALHERFTIRINCWLNQKFPAMTAEHPMIDSICFEYQAPAPILGHTVRVPNSEDTNGYQHFHIDSHLAGRTSGLSNLPTEIGPSGEIVDYVVVCPDLRQWHDYAEWYHCRGALFKKTKCSGSRYELLYLRSVHIAFEDAGMSVSTVSLGKSQMIEKEYYMADLVPEDVKLLVHCDISSWPSAEHYFDSPEEPLFQHVHGCLMGLTMLSVQLGWILWFVVGMSLNVGRVPMGCIFVFKVLLMGAEAIWFTPVAERLQQRFWVEDFSGGAPMNSNEADGGRAAGWHAWEVSLLYPSLLFGPRRFLVGLAALIVIGTLTLTTTVMGTGAAGVWGFSVVLFEVTIRTCAYLIWTYGMRTKLVRSWVDFLDVWWLHFVASVLDPFRNAHVTRSREHEPYREELDVNPELFLWG
ncbi:hypothetical protein PG990_002746 [Apiospora arundinis]